MWSVACSAHFRGVFLLAWSIMFAVSSNDQAGLTHRRAFDYPFWPTPPMGDTLRPWAQTLQRASRLGLVFGAGSLGECVTLCNASH